MKQAMHLIVGLGVTGRSIAHYLAKRNQSFAFYDTRTVISNRHEWESEFPNSPIYLGDFPEELYSLITEIITSPGVPLDCPVLKRAYHLAIPVMGDIECLAREISAPIIAITGTNGKSTVTTLVGQMAEAAGLTTAVCGNIGTPVLDVLDDSVDYDLWVLELSSFQLDLTETLKPLTATILNISPDHLDRHHHLDNYIAAKQRIYNHVQFALFNRDDALTAPTTPVEKTQSFGLSIPEKNDWGIAEINNRTALVHGETVILFVDEMHLKGQHNWQNALAACALAFNAGINYAAMATVLRTFQGLKHRCQWVRTLEDVTYINDSKGTNIGATDSAIQGIGKTIQGKIILIAGGVGKNADFTELNETVKQYVSKVVLLGQDADKIAAAFDSIVPTIRVNSLQEAIDTAKSGAQPNDVILLSPACASQDMFKDFNDRGEQFTRLVSQL